MREECLLQVNLPCWWHSSQEKLLCEYYLILSSRLANCFWAYRWLNKLPKVGVIINEINPGKIPITSVIGQNSFHGFLNPSNLQKLLKTPKHGNLATYVSFIGNLPPNLCKIYTFTSPWVARPLNYSFSGFRKPRQLPKPVKTRNLFFPITDAWNNYMIMMYWERALWGTPSRELRSWRS